MDESYKDLLEKVLPHICAKGITYEDILRRLKEINLPTESREFKALVVMTLDKLSKNNIVIEIYVRLKTGGYCVFYVPGRSQIDINGNEIKINMKLFSLEVIGKISRGEIVKLIILAPSEEAARKLAVEEDTGRFINEEVIREKWTNPRKTSCVEVSLNSGEKIIATI